MGEADGPALLAPAPLATAAEGARCALQQLAGAQWRGGALDAAALLGERAAIFGFQRRGRTSPGGSCRLLRARDAWMAVNLARESDRDMLEAWLEAGLPEDSWAHVEAELPKRRASQWLERSRLLGLPVAELPRGIVGSAASGIRCVAEIDATAGPAQRPPLVVDLSSLWAGPLCGHLLGLAGARVVKCESFERPDGARTGPRAFFDLLNADKECVAFEFASESGRAALRRLLECADIVIESARPRALAGFGIHAEQWIAARSGRTWVSITGYGRTGPEADWVAFGDDAAAASGLAWATARFNGLSGPVFCGDAIADPLTGLHAAVAALASFQRGGSRLLDVSLRGVVASVLALVEKDPFAVCFAPGRAPSIESPNVALPRARAVSAHARDLGVDTEPVMKTLRDLA
ncbi:MAG: hypothetical protein GY733_00465 [bacterium]|nr:hypothetical protein [bacterium]